MTDGEDTNPNGKISTPEAPFMSSEEAALVEETYRKATVILEYGSGGSTRIASKMPGKLVFSVESSFEWAMDLQAEIDASDPTSPVTLYPVDIGEVGPWGRPITMKNWRKFQRYPTAIWDEPFFRHPDVILIDGRMRSACLVHAMMRIEKPVTVLFDDYRVRKLYQNIESLIQPDRIVGTLAQFSLTPDSLPKSKLSLVIRQFFLCSIDGGGEAFYDIEDLL